MVYKELMHFCFLEVRYQCYGSWYAMRGSGKHAVGYTFAVISDTVEKDNRERFKCLVSVEELENKVQSLSSNDISS